jgi:hypothetical protein
MEEGYTQLGTVLIDQRLADSEEDGVIVVGRVKGDRYDGVQLSYPQRGYIQRGREGGRSPRASFLSSLAYSSEPVGNGRTGSRGWSCW